jgi:undecaprenyl-diphosphatase
MTVDDWVDDRFARLHGNPVADRIFYGASWFGDDGRGWIAASLIRSRRAEKPWPTFLRQIAWLGIESAIVNGPAKGAVRRPRPSRAREHRHHLRRPSNSSFPSGHAASAATMAMLLSEDGLAPLWWTLAGTVAVSRIYVGVHHASDVAAGLAAGAAIGWAARHITLPLAIVQP